MTSLLHKTQVTTLSAMAASQTNNNRGNDDDDDILAVDSSEVEEKTSVWRQLVQSLNPKTCLAPTSCQNPLVDEELDVMVHKLGKDLQNDGKPRVQALIKLYRLTDRDRSFNRYVYLSCCSNGSQRSCDSLPVVLIVFTHTSLSEFP